MSAHRATACDGRGTGLLRTLRILVDRRAAGLLRTPRSLVYSARCKLRSASGYISEAPVRKGVMMAVMAQCNRAFQGVGVLRGRVGGEEMSRDCISQAPATGL